MTNKKGLLARLAAAALALTVALAGAAPAVALAEDEETYVPKYEIKGKTLKVNKKSAKAGQKVKISVKVTGKPKYVYARLVRVVKSGSTQSLSIRLKKKGGNTYAGNAKITNAWAKGTWRVSYITASGKKNSYDDEDYASMGYYEGDSYGLKKVQFKVKGTVGDKKAPNLDLSSIKVSKKKVNVTKKNKKIKVTIKASDAMSKLGDYAYVSFVKRDKKGNNYYISGTLKKKGNGYKGTLTVYKGSEKGTYKLESIEISDSFSNWAYTHAKTAKKYDKKQLKQRLKEYKSWVKEGWLTKKVYKSWVKSEKAYYKKIKYADLKKFKIVVK